MIERWDNGYTCSCCHDSGINVEELEYSSDSENSPDDLSKMDGYAIEEAKKRGYKEVHRLATDNLIK